MTPTPPPPPPAPRHPRAGFARLADGPRLRAPLAGRGGELAQLREAVDRAIEGRAAQLVTVLGSQGTGKTRLVDELVARLEADGAPARVLRGRAGDGGERHATIGALLRDRFGLAGADDHGAAAAMAAAVREVFGGEPVAEVLHVLGALVGLEFPATPFLELLGDAALRLDHVVHGVLRRFLERDASRGPLVLVLDDLHLADAAELALLVDLAAGLASAPVAIVACARPELLVRCPGWGRDHDAALRLELRNLEPAHAEEMFRGLLARCDHVPDDVADAAVGMTGGNPHFLEQLVRLFLADGTLEAGGPRWRLDAARAAAAELPLTVEQAIEARVAALEPEELELLEKGAVFGNVFWLSAVVAASRLEQPPPSPREPLEYAWGRGEPVHRRLAALLGALVERDYVLVLEPEDSAIPGDLEVVFKHNLERELVARSTAPERRARYHLSAAQWLEARIAGRGGEQLEVLAMLFERGGELARAARAYVAAGDRARQRHGGDEARALYERALALLDADGHRDAHTRMECLHALGAVLDVAGRADEALARFAEMLQVAWRHDNPAKAGAATSRMARVHRRRGEYDRAMAHLRRAHELFEAAHDERGVAASLDDMGVIHWLRGGYAQALDFHREALGLRKRLGDRRSIAVSLANIGRVHRDCGNFKAAIAQLREALDQRRDVDDRAGLVQSLCDLASVHTADGNHELALGLLGEAQTVARDIGDELALATALVRAGEAEAQAGRAGEALSDLAEARRLAGRLGDRALVAESHRWTAVAALALGDLAGAAAAATAAIDAAAAVGARVTVAGAHRVLAELAAARGEVAEAERHFERAVEILTVLRNAVELAQTLRACAGFRARLGASVAAAELLAEADAIFARLRGAVAD